MIEFQEPPLQMDLAEVRKACSSCVGFCIALGAKFFNSGVKDVDDVILPVRVFPGYAILFWFVKIYTCLIPHFKE